MKAGTQLVIAGIAFGMLTAAACRDASRGMIVLCAGDSLTEQGYPAALRRILAERGVRVRVLNHGRSGNTSGEYLEFLKSKRARLAAERPDVVLLMLGTNDVRVDGDRASREDFAAHMAAIIEIFRGFRSRGGRPARVVIATVPPVPETAGPPFGPGSTARVRDEINPAIGELAAREGLPLVDQYAVFASAAQDLLPGIHPTAAGYERMAAAWADALLPPAR